MLYTIKLKPVNVKPSMHIDVNKKNNEKVPKFEVDHQEIISKYKNIFAKNHIPGWSQEVFEIKKVKKSVS